MALAEGGRAETVIVARVLFAADPQPRDVQQVDNGGDDGGLVVHPSTQIMVDPAPQRWQRPAERCAAIELVMLPLGAEMRVVAVLPPPAPVVTDCLYVAGRVNAEPAALVGGREAQRIEAADRFAIADPLALPIIAPTLAKARARYAGSRNVRKG